MTGLDDALSGVSRLGFDTSPFIYLVEQDPTRLTIVKEIFRRADSGAFLGVTSVITLAEVLTQPLKMGANQLADEYRDLLLTSRSMILASIHPAEAQTAADLRARYHLRTPDAFQIAAALISGCQAFLTNDRNHLRVKDLRILVVDDLRL